MSTEIISIACPFCCMSRVLIKKGSRAVAEHKLDPLTPAEERKGRIRFDRFDLETGFFIQMREAGGSLPPTEEETIATQRGKHKGRGKSKGFGFPLVSGLTVNEAKSLPEYQDLLEQIKNQCQNLLNKLT